MEELPLLQNSELPSAFEPDSARTNSQGLVRQDTQGPKTSRSRSPERVPSQQPNRHGAALGLGHSSSSKGTTAAPLMIKPKHARQTNKQVTLPLAGQSALEGSRELGEDIKKSLHTLCVADGFDLKEVMSVLRQAFPGSDLHLISECLHCCINPHPDYHSPEVFLFDYGVVIFWGCTERVRNDLMRSIQNEQCQIDPLRASEIERDEFSVIYKPVERATIANDTITIPQLYSSDWRIKMAISHGMAQSAKLCLYEERMGDLVNRTKDMPAYLAKTGKVSRTRKQIAQLIGTVFIHKSNVNLLSSVLDTPEYFWSAPDLHQKIYKGVTDYLELEQRITVLNSRFEVLTELLNIVREHENNLHIARLEWIVIYLIVVEVVVGLLECASILGFVKRSHVTL